MKESLWTDQEFLNFGIFSSFKESDIEDFEATAQPLHMEAAQIVRIFSQVDNLLSLAVTDWVN